MPGVNTSSRSLSCRSRCKRAHQQPHATQCPSRMAPSSQLMAQGSGLIIPRLVSVPVVHQLVADDHQAVMP